MNALVIHDETCYPMAIDLDATYTTWIALYPDARGEIARYSVPLLDIARERFTGYLDRLKRGETF